MPAMTFRATIADDGMLRLAIPGAASGSDVEISVTPKAEAMAEKGWPIGFHERMFGCISDETFVRHLQPSTALN